MGRDRPKFWIVYPVVVARTRRPDQRRIPRHIGVRRYRVPANASGVGVGKRSMHVHDFSKPVDQGDCWMPLIPIHPGEPYTVPIHIPGRDLTGETITVRIAVGEVDIASVSSSSGGVTILNQSANNGAELGKAVAKFEGSLTSTFPFRMAVLIVCLTDSSGDTYVVFTGDLSIEWPRAC